jgi:flagellar basal body rod protein FlgG
MAARGIYPALSGAMAESRALEAVSSNLSNLGTSSFRGQRVSFRETLAQAQGAQAQNRAQARGDLRFVRVAEPIYDVSPGPVRQTGQPGDVALAGPGFLGVQTPAGLRYVRGGTLTRAPDGRLLLGQGPQAPEVVGAADKKPLVVPQGELLIGGKGEVLVGGKQVGQLLLTEFARPQSLRGQGGGLYAPAAGDAGAPAEKTEVLPGYLEGANVNPMRAMTDVIMTSRHYEALHRVIETYREIDTTAAREVATIA